MKLSSKILVKIGKRIPEPLRTKLLVWFLKRKFFKDLSKEGTSELEKVFRDFTKKADVV